MTSQIPYGEAWLLETLALNRLPVWGLGRGEKAMREWLNRGFHNLAPGDLFNTLRLLFDSGDVEAFAGDDETGFNPSDEQLRAALRRQNMNLFCGATGRGGMRWESLATPDWKRYFTDLWCDGNRVELAAGSQERLLEIVDSSKLLWNVSIDSTSLNIECLHPWEPLGWKSLPEGFKTIAVCARLPHEERLAEYSNNRRRYLELRTWATSICGHAYV